jgi:hypothetical protein
VDICIMGVMGELLEENCIQFSEQGWIVTGWRTITEIYDIPPLLARTYTHTFFHPHLPKCLHILKIHSPLLTEDDSNN